MNGLTADRYADFTYARTNFPLVDGTTNFTAIAQSPIGLSSTNTVTVDLRATNTLVYDLNGNLRTNGNQIFDYDDENQLVTNWVASAWKSEFVYDGANRLRVSRDYGWQSGGWVKTNEVRLFYDGVVVIQERDTNNTPLTSYTRSGSYLLARTENSAASHAYYHTDGNRNVTALVNTSQLIVAKYLYDPFGNTLAMSGPLAGANLYQFASQRYHANSGLSLYLRRAYSPALQRFINRDPIEEEGGINLYGFVGNDAINGFDPLGLILGDDSSSFWVAYFGRVVDPRAHLQNLTRGDTFRTASAYSYHVLKSPYELAKLAYEIDQAKWHPIESAKKLLAMIEGLKKLPCEWEKFWRSSPENQMEGLGGFTGDLAGGWATQAGAVNMIKALQPLQAAELGLSRTFSSGTGAYTGGPRMTLAEARAAAEAHGIDMRMFELQYAPGNQYDWGSVSRYFNHKTLADGPIVRAPNGRIVLTLYDKGLRSVSDLVETVSHELNHVRGYFRSGTFTSEASAEAAAEAARPHIR